MAARRKYKTNGHYDMQDLPAPNINDIESIPSELFDDPTKLLAWLDEKSNADVPATKQDPSPRSESSPLKRTKPRSVLSQAESLASSKTENPTNRETRKRRSGSARARIADLSYDSSNSPSAQQKPREKGRQQPPKVKQDALSQDNSWELSYLSDRGIRYIDNRRKGGALWIIADRPVTKELSYLQSYGLSFQYSAKGSGASKGLPAWWTKDRPSIWSHYAAPVPIKTKSARGTASSSELEKKQIGRGDADRKEKTVSANDPITSIDTAKEDYYSLHRTGTQQEDFRVADYYHEGSFFVYPELAGILMGISFDNQLNEEEIRSLLKWLRSINDNSYEGINPIIELLERYIEDGTIDSNEERHLLELFQAIIDSSFQAPKVAKHESFDRQASISNDENAKQLPYGSFILFTETTGECYRQAKSDILFIKAHGTTSFVQTKSGVAEIKMGLHEAERKLKPSGFIRPHRSFLINTKHVMTIAELPDGTFLIKLDTGLFSIPAHKSSKKMLIQTFGGQKGVIQFPY